MSPDQPAARPPSGSTAPANPVRRRTSAAVFRRRRQVVLGVLLLVVAGLLWGLVSLLGSVAATNAGKNAPKDDPSVPAVAPSVPTEQIPSPQASPAKSSAPPCPIDKIVVEGAPDTDIYRSDMNPRLTLKVTSAAENPCELNVGTSQQEFIVTKKGGDQVWSSAHCQVSPQDDLRTIAPKKSEVAVLDWPRRLSAPGCQKVDGIPQPGTYVLTVKLAGKESRPVEFVLQ